MNVVTSTTTMPMEDTKMIELDLEDSNTTHIGIMHINILGSTLIDFLC
jgi:hypothetical protein